ncbi:MAG: tRNA epoxyqueuosine(34) reductase QueG [Planctomycetota bacterium]|jgi:epoxyqueuosine reductase
MDVGHETREQVRAAFLAEGFARVGFTSADPVRDRASPWVDQGMHAGMAYMARDPAARADPGALLPGARSVICAAAAYPATDARGPIAGYARAEDYHRTLRDALVRGERALQQLVPGAVTRCCVDTSPLLERALAARAGLGWIGRNTMLLDETHGPWMLLGEVLTDVGFPPDAPARDRCGTCTACIDACPTQALVGERTLDARRCLSYWTIEHRGELPREWAEALGGRVFGCDDCLTACPFPVQAPRAAAAQACTNNGGPPPIVPRADLAQPTLDDLEARARESFRRHFASTPIERARKHGLLRNLAAAREGPKR